MDDSVLILHEDFSSFPPGKLPFDYSPRGEYHCIPLEGYTGRWREATIHNKWRTGNWSIVPDLEGRRCLQQDSLIAQSQAIIVTGEESWQDYHLRVRIRTLSPSGIAGVIVRYLHNRRFLCVYFEGSELRAAYRNHESWEHLGAVNVGVEGDTFREIAVAAKGSRLAVSLEGKEVISIELRPDIPTGGKIGCIATAPARFAELLVTTSPTEKEGQVVRRSQRKAETEDLALRFARPTLWRRIGTPGYGTAKNMRVGDLDGDGRAELLLVQNTKALDTGNYPLISCLTAIDLEGKILWQRGAPGAQNHMTTADIPCQVHDIDGDKRCEIIFAQDFRLNIADGRTGKILRSAPMPLAPKHSSPIDADPSVFFRVNGDSIMFADLSGQGAPRDIIIKDRYSTIWALDERLEVLWSHSCNTGHFPFAADVDHDGRDEIMIGYTLLDHDGTVMWDLRLTDHADSVYVGKLAPGAEMQLVLAGGDEGFVLADMDGTIRRHDKIGHLQVAHVAKFIPELDGLQIASITYWGNPGIVTVFDRFGNRVSEFEVMSVGSSLDPVNWSGDGQELLFLTAHPDYGGLYDAYGRLLVPLPSDGRPFLCWDAFDLTGDSRDELLVWDEKVIHIYTQEGGDSKQLTYHPVRSPHYNYSNYRAKYAIP